MIKNKPQFGLIGRIDVKLSTFVVISTKYEEISMDKWD